MIEKKILAKIGLGHQKHIYENKILTKIGLRQEKRIYDPETYVLDILHAVRFYKIIEEGSRTSDVIMGGQIRVGE